MKKNELILSLQFLVKGNYINLNFIINNKIREILFFTKVLLNSFVNNKVTLSTKPILKFAINYLNLGIDNDSLNYLKDNNIIDYEDILKLESLGTLETILNGRDDVTSFITVSNKSRYLEINNIFDIVLRFRDNKINIVDLLENIDNQSINDNVKEDLYFDIDEVTKLKVNSLINIISEIEEEMKEMNKNCIVVIDYKYKENNYKSIFNVN